MHKRSRGGGRDAFFDPFAGLAAFGGLGGHGSLMSSMFGGRDPFDDLFFRNPFGSMFESSLFGSFGSPFANMQSSGFLEHHAPVPKRSRGPIIEEINSDDEKEEAEKDEETSKNSIEPPSIDHPDEDGERVNKQMQLTGSHRGSNQMHLLPQAGSYTFQSSSVTYGGSNGTYYSSSRTKRTGSDGVTFEECREADTSTGKATHKISRGLRNKGHSLTKKLNSDGKVNTMQTLHNLNEDELDGFEKAWAKNARGLPSWIDSSNSSGAIGYNWQTSRAGCALPSNQHRPPRRMAFEDCSNPGSSRSQHTGRRKNNSISRKA